jgi:hypothetical protein
LLTNRPTSPVGGDIAVDDQATAAVEDQEIDTRPPSDTTDTRRRGLRRRRRVRETPDGQLVFYL